jgi:hypothetical protein
MDRSTSRSKISRTEWPSRGATSHGAATPTRKPRGPLPVPARERRAGDPTHKAISPSCSTLRPRRYGTAQSGTRQTRTTARFGRRVSSGRSRHAAMVTRPLARQCAHNEPTISRLSSHYEYSLSGAQWPKVGGRNPEVQVPNLHAHTRWLY